MVVLRKFLQIWFMAFGLLLLLSLLTFFPSPITIINGYMGEGKKVYNSAKNVERNFNFAISCFHIIDVSLSVTFQVHPALNHL